MEGASNNIAAKMIASATNISDFAVEVQKASSKGRLYVDAKGTLSAQKTEGAVKLPMSMIKEIYSELRTQNQGPVHASTIKMIENSLPFASLRNQSRISNQFHKLAGGLDRAENKYQQKLEKKFERSDALENSMANFVKIDKLSSSVIKSDENTAYFKVKEQIKSLSEEIKSSKDAEGSVNSTSIKDKTATLTSLYAELKENRNSLMPNLHDEAITQMDNVLNWFDESGQISETKMEEITQAFESKDNIGKLDEKLVSLTVAHKNTQSDNYAETVKSTLKEVNAALENLPKLKTLSNDPNFAAIEHKLTFMSRQLQTMSGEKVEPLPLHQNVPRILELANKELARNATVKRDAVTETKEQIEADQKELRTLWNELKKDDVIKLTDSLIEKDMHSDDYENNTRQIIGMLKNQTSKENELLNKDLLSFSSIGKDFLTNVQFAYNSSPRGLSEVQAKFEKGFNDAKSDVVRKQNFLAQGLNIKLENDLKTLIDHHEQLVKNASPEERETALSNMGKAITDEIKDLGNKAKQEILRAASEEGIEIDYSSPNIKDLPVAFKNQWRSRLQEMLPEYNEPMYNLDNPHGFDRIFAQLSAPSAADTVTDVFKKLMSTEDKLKPKNSIA